MRNTTLDFVARVLLDFRATYEILLITRVPLDFRATCETLLIAGVPLDFRAIYETLPWILRQRFL